MTTVKGKSSEIVGDGRTTPIGIRCSGLYTEFDLRVESGHIHHWRGGDMGQMERTETFVVRLCGI